ncbi:MAG: transglutaminase family protein [Bacteroidales bacterium]
MKLDSELISLTSLMDDPDLVVRNAVRERLIERGEDALEQIERFFIPDVPEQARERYVLYLDDIKADIAIKTLSQLLKEPQPILNKALFLITKVADTSAQEVIYFSTLENLTNEITIEMSGEKTPVENVEIFNFLFFKRFGFRHSNSHLTKIESALIDRVLLSRVGNPVTITLSYFLLAAAVGLPVYPLSFPGGFVPVYLDNDGKILFYLNVFKQGTIFLENTLKQFFEEMGMTYNPELLRVEQERSLLSIYAEFLSFIYKKNSDDHIMSRIDKVVSLIGKRKFL